MKLFLAALLVNAVAAFNAAMPVIRAPLKAARPAVAMSMPVR